MSELRAEVATNLGNLDTRIEQNRAGLARFEQFMTSEPAELASLPCDSAMEWGRSFAAPWTFDAGRGVSLTLSDPEGLVSVRDPQIRRLVVDWLALLDDMEEEASMMWTSGDEVIRALSHPSLQGPVPEDVPPWVWNSAANRGPGVLRAWRDDEDLVAPTSIKMYYQRIYLAELRQARELGASIVEMLDDAERER